MNRLDAGAWDAIHDQILRDGRVQRETYNSLTRAAAGEPVTIEVTAQTLEVMTPDRAGDLIRRYGIGLVSAGYAHTVLRRSALLTATDLTEPTVQLTLGFATFSLGDYFTARGHLARAMPGRGHLSAFDRYFLDSLVAECDFRFGRTDEAGRAAELAKIEAEAPGFLALQLRLDRVRRDHLRELDPVRSGELHAQLCRLVEGIEAEPGASEAMKLQARLVQFHANGAAAVMGFLYVVLDMQVRAGMRAPVTPAVIADLRAAAEAEAAVERESSLLHRRAVELGHPMLIADALVAQASQRIIRFIDLPVISRAMGHEPRPIPDEIISGMQEALNQAITLYGAVGNTEGRVRATLLLARWLELNGSATQAAALAREILGVARAMAYDQDAQDAADLLEGRSEYRQLVDRLASPPDTDAGMSGMSDEDVRRFAKSTHESLRIPGICYPVVERVAFVFRQIARERMSWCHHLDLQELRLDDSSPDRWYATDPEWRATCSLHGHRTLVVSTDAEAIIAAFKGCSCTGCPNRSPKGEPR